MLPPSVLARSAPQVASAVRQMSVISGPPKTRVSLAEKWAHGLLIAVGILALPTYVLVNIKNYKARD